MKKSFILALIFFLGSGCARLMRSDTLSYNNIEMLSDGQAMSCSLDDAPYALAGQNESSFDIFGQTLRRIQRQMPLKSIDEFVLWSLFQMNLRPDASTPRARFQAMLTIGNELKYWDVTQKDLKDETASPYLYALDQMLKYYKSNYSLEQLARGLDQGLPMAIPVSLKLALILKNHTPIFSQNDVLRETYLKARHTLRQDETLPRLHYHNLVRSMRRSLQEGQSYQVQNHLFEDETQELTTRCNFDINIYRHSIYLVALEATNDANPFMMSKKNGDQFMAVSSQISFKEQKGSIGKTFLLQGTPNPQALAFCSLESIDGTIKLMNTQGRDTAQQIFQLVERGIHHAQDLRQIDQHNRHLRFLYLYNPERIVYESHRANGEQSGLFLQTRKPLYHAQSIGNVWGQMTLGTQKKSALMIDSRHQGGLSCLKRN